MENYQMFIPGSSIPIFHDFAKKKSSFDFDFEGRSSLDLLMGSSRIESNMESRSSQEVIPNRVQVNHDQEQVIATNYTGSFSVPGSERSEITEKKKGEKKVRKPRFAFQTRSQVDILDDGYRWRKYGQKAVKNNKFPRSYYRCTHKGCNVKKQVQRLSKDEGVVVTTYEGTHSHPVDKSTDNFENILSQMHIIYPPPPTTTTTTLPPFHHI